MQRYFIDAKNIEGSYIHIDSYNHKHMQRVMRYRNGDQVVCILPSTHSYVYEIIDIEEGLLKQKEMLEEDHELDVELFRFYQNAVLLKQMRKHLIKRRKDTNVF